MKISTRGRYGVRFMLDLAVNESASAVSLGEVASRQGISEKYLWQVVNPLKAAGIIQSVRGAGGGYRLARNPVDLTLREIISVLEGGLAITDCIEDAAGCDLSATCVVRRMWQRFTDNLAHSMEQVTLKELADEYRLARNTSAINYEI